MVAIPRGRERLFSLMEYRHVVTIVQKPRIDGATLCAFMKIICEFNANILKIERLSTKEHAAVHQANR